MGAAPRLREERVRRIFGVSQRASSIKWTRWSRSASSESRRRTAWNSYPEVDEANLAFELMTDTECASAGRKPGLRT
jgi:hypothetical protein